MACLELDSNQFLSTILPYGEQFILDLEGGVTGEFAPHDCAATPEAEAEAEAEASGGGVPPPPPLPPRNGGYVKAGCLGRVRGFSFVLDEAKKAWERLLDEEYGADVRVLAEDKGVISAHSCVLGISSPVLRKMLEQARVKGGFRCIIIPGVPLEAARAFIRFLYSSCYEQDVMNKYVLHLLVLSHTFSVPSLKKVCIDQLDQALLTAENVVDVLQLARQCDAPRLSLSCTRIIIKDFKAISSSEGWKVMKHANPSLEQELLESLVEADSRKQERIKKKEEKKVYKQLYEAMEALLHICSDGCRTIGPRDKKLKDSQSTCSFPACKGIESLVRHFWRCKTRIPGGCVHCKRMWQLLELHSCMCTDPVSCKVPLCGHFKGKVLHQNKKEELRWKLLVRRVMAAKGTISSISAWRSCAA